MDGSAWRSAERHHRTPHGPGRTKVPVRAERTPVTGQRIVDLRAVIAVVGFGAIVVKGVTVLPGFWRGEHARSVYQNLLAAGLPSKWTARLVQSTHLVIVWCASMFAILVASVFGSFESGPLTALDWVLMSLLGCSTTLCLVAALTGHPRWLMPPWARGQSAEDFLSDRDGPPDG